MKLNQLLEARLVSGQRNDIIAKWLANRLLHLTFDRGHSYAENLFIGNANKRGPEGGLQSAVEAVQEYNVVIEFIRKHSDNRNLDTISPQQLEKWIRYWKAT